jgi:hypothetical protein
MSFHEAPPTAQASRLRLPPAAALAAALLLRLPCAAAAGDCASCQQDRRPRPPPPPPPLDTDSAHSSATAAPRPPPLPPPPGGGAAAWSDSAFEARNGARVLSLTPLAFSCVACAAMLALVFTCTYLRRRLFAARDARAARVTRVRVLLEAVARATAAGSRPQRDPSAPVLGAPLLALPWPPVVGTPAPPLRVELAPPSGPSGDGLELQPARCARKGGALVRIAP